MDCYGDAGRPTFGALAVGALRIFTSHHLMLDKATVTQSIALITLLVRDYDEAISFFTHALRFELIEDTAVTADKRWVVVAPPDSGNAAGGASLLLAKAATPEQEARIGDQTGGRVFMFLHTQNFWADYRHMLEHGVKFAEEPREETYGHVVVFFDICGNKWDLLEASGD